MALRSGQLRSCTRFGRRPSALYQNLLSRKKATEAQSRSAAATNSRRQECLDVDGRTVRVAIAWSVNHGARAP